MFELEKENKKLKRDLIIATEKISGSFSEQFYNLVEERGVFETERNQTKQLSMATGINLLDLHCTGHYFIIIFIYIFINFIY